MATRNIRYQPQNFGQNVPYAIPDNFLGDVELGSSFVGDGWPNAVGDTNYDNRIQQNLGGDLLPNSITGQENPMSMWDSFLNKAKDTWDKTPMLDTVKDGMRTPGALTSGLGAVNGVMSGLMAMKNYGLQKDSLNMQREFANKNYAAQRSTTNSNLRDRQAARVASNPGAYQSVGDYMNKNGIA